MYNYFGRFEFYLSETYGQLDDKPPLTLHKWRLIGFETYKDQPITSDT